MKGGRGREGKKGEEKKGGSREIRKEEGKKRRSRRRKHKIVWELTANFTSTLHPLTPPHPCTPHTPTQVASMQKELEELQPKLVTAREENAKMMVVIERESVEVEARSKVVRKDEEVANEKAAEAKALKEEVRRVGGGGKGG